MRHRRLQTLVAAGLLAAFATIAAIGGVSGIPSNAIRLPQSRTTAPCDPAKALTRPVQFGDTFDSGTTLGWDKQDDAGASMWALQRGTRPVTSYGVVLGRTQPEVRLRESSNLGAGSAGEIQMPGTMHLFGNTGWRGLRYSVRAKLNEPDAAAGVVFGYRSTTDYYRFSWGPGFAQLVRRSATGWDQIWKGDTGLPHDRWYRITTDIACNDVKINVIDETAPAASVLTVTKHLASEVQGRVGVYAWRAQSAFFDDVQVRANAAQGFTIAVLPDTQYYVEDAHTDKKIFEAQTSWLATNRATQKIAFVLHEGDVVGSMCQPRQWDRAGAAMKVLDGKLPYAITPGNHDTISYNTVSPIDSSSTVNPDCEQLGFPIRTINTSMWNAHFPDYVFTRFQPQTWQGTMVAGDSSASWHRFSAGGVSFVVIALPFGPSQQQVTWARGIASEHPADTVILLTHDFLHVDGSIRGSDPAHPHLPSITGQLTGQQMWEQLVNPSPNIRFAFNGHVVSCHLPGASNPCVAAQTGTGFAGRPRADQTDTGWIARSSGSRLYAMLANYQGMQPAGGNGYMRLLRFVPPATAGGTWTVKVETRTDWPGAAAAGVSPRLADARNQFTLTGVQL